MSAGPGEVPVADPYRTPVASVEPAAIAREVVALWSPKAVAVITFFLSFPSTLLLVLINRRRLGDTRFPTALVISTVLLALATIAFSFLFPERRALGLNLLLNLAMVFYFRYQVIADVSAYRKVNPDAAPRRRGWGSAVLWSLVGLAVCTAAAFAVEALASAWGYYPAE